MSALEAYDWPGNVRHLFNALESAVVQAEGTTIRPRDLLREIIAGTSSRAESVSPGAALMHYYKPTGDACTERALILKVLEESSGNKARLQDSHARTPCGNG